MFKTVGELKYLDEQTALEEGDKKRASLSTFAASLVEDEDKSEGVGQQRIDQAAETGSIDDKSGGDEAARHEGTPPSEQKKSWAKRMSFENTSAFCSGGRTEEQSSSGAAQTGEETEEMTTPLKYCEVQ